MLKISLESQTVRVHKTRSKNIGMHSYIMDYLTSIFLYYEEIWREVATSGSSFGRPTEMHFSVALPRDTGEALPALPYEVREWRSFLGGQCTRSENSAFRVISESASSSSLCGRENRIFRGCGHEKLQSKFILSV